MAETYYMISLIAFGLSALLLVTAVVLWFRLKIARAIGVLSGRTAKRTIARMDKGGNNPVSAAASAAGFASRRTIPATGGGGVSMPPGTTLLDSSGDAPYADGTQRLAGTSSATVLLPNQGTQRLSEIETAPAALSADFKIHEDILIIHTREEIE